MNETGKFRLCVVTFPIESSGKAPLANLINILSALSSELYLVTGNEGYKCLKNHRNVHAYKVDHKKGTNVIYQIIRYAWTQANIAYLMLKLRKNTDCYIFFFGGDGLIVPFVTAKLLNKTIISVPADYIMKFNGDKLSRILMGLSKITRHISDKIIVYSPNLIKEWNLGKYRKKVSIAHEHIINFEKFKMTINYNSRDNLIGYVGRLSAEKGIMNFVKAIPLILREVNNLNIILVGDGDLRNEIEEYIMQNGLNSMVQIVGWIPHEKLNSSLNNFKLLVLPSFTEGLPNIVLESMACGTPVVATPVGAIPDIIENNVTGFIIENNSPECISTNVIQIMNNPNLELIADNARHIVEKKFTYDAALENYKCALENLRME